MRNFLLLAAAAAATCATCTTAQYQSIYQPERGLCVHADYSLGSCYSTDTLYVIYTDQSRLVDPDGKCLTVLADRGASVNCSNAQANTTTLGLGLRKCASPASAAAAASRQQWIVTNTRISNGPQLCLSVCEGDSAATNNKTTKSVVQVDTGCNTNFTLRVMSQACGVWLKRNKCKKSRVGVPVTRCRGQLTYEACEAVCCMPGPIDATPPGTLPPTATPTPRPPPPHQETRTVTVTATETVTVTVTETLSAAGTAAPPAPAPAPAPAPPAPPAVTETVADDETGTEAAATTTATPEESPKCSHISAQVELVVTQ
jgi:hypothetical protein